MDHDHDSTTHSMTCPAEGCTFEIKVHAHDDNEAVMNIMQKGKAHFEEMHPNEKGMSSEEMEQMTRKAMKKH